MRLPFDATRYRGGEPLSAEGGSGGVSGGRRRGGKSGKSNGGVKPGKFILKSRMRLPFDATRYRGGESLSVEEGWEGIWEGRRGWHISCRRDPRERLRPILLLRFFPSIIYMSTNQYI
eukprot:1393724-Amorphochlora_amoeboformis.AAC.3